jgi:hypothetical protein
VRLSPWAAVSYRLGAVAATPLPAFLAVGIPKSGGVT